VLIGLACTTFDQFSAILCVDISGGDIYRRAGQSSLIGNRLTDIENVINPLAKRARPSHLPIRPPLVDNQAS
jgi:hypothetical protein